MQQSEAKLFIQDEPKIPEKVEELVKPITVAYKDYFDTRLNPLGITEDSPENIIEIQTYIGFERKPEIVKEKVFQRTKMGIKILVYTIEGEKFFYKPQGSTDLNIDERGFNTNTQNRWSKELYITRLEVPKINNKGEQHKYNLASGQIVQPFFPPKLVEKYRKKQKGSTLYLTEGYIKAFYATKCGIDCVGIPSITTLKNKETGKLHEDIVKLIKTCGYERLVWLVDGDCRNITSKEITDGLNLTKRPAGFFRSCNTFYDLTSKIENCTLYFSFVNTDNLAEKPKGIDDLLLAYPEKQKEIAKKFNDFSTIKQEYEYFIRFNITAGIGNIRRYLYLHDVTDFYLFHCEKRPELKGKEFKFYNTTYKYDEDKNVCVIKVPGDASNYVRIGDTYYEKLKVPDHLGNYFYILERRDKQTIKDDYGQDIFKHIEKFKGFVNIPDHINYQPSIDNFYNRYSPIPHELEEGTIDTSLDFLKHIFGTEEITVDNNKKIQRWEMGLDYITILWRYPTQILPILSLVSEERQTGKTKFIEWLCYLFSENAIVIGNQDLENKFNKHWNGKLIICVDEAKIERFIVMERIKALSTSSFIIDEGKGADQKKTGFFGKFILNSNNVKNFAHIDEKEIRFWVNEVPTVTKRNVDLLADLCEEAPAFLSYISKREIICPRVERHWFETRLLRTKALERVVENSKPKVNQLLFIALVELFEATQAAQITMPLDIIVKELLRGKYDRNYVKDTLNEMGYKSKPSARLKFPRLVEKAGLTGAEIVPEWIAFHTTYYEFKEENFKEPIVSETPKKGVRSNVNDIL